MVKMGQKVWVRLIFSQKQPPPRDFVPFPVDSLGSSGHFDLLVPYPDSNAMADIWGCQVGPAIFEKVKKNREMVKIGAKSCCPLDFFPRKSLHPGTSFLFQSIPGVLEIVLIYWYHTPTRRL